MSDVEVVVRVTESDVEVDGGVVTASDVQVGLCAVEGEVMCLM